MEQKNEILEFCIRNGFLLDNELLKIFNEERDVETLKLFLQKIKNYTQKRIITKNILQENSLQFDRFIEDLPSENQKVIEKLKINLGLSIEIEKETTLEKPKEKINLEDYENRDLNGVKVVSNFAIPNKKLEVKDFVNYFRIRFNTLKDILLEHSELTNLTSINKISGNKQGVSIIGLISDKNKTKNGNVIFEVEDLTGKIKVLVSKSKEELLEKAEELPLDAVVGFRCSGNREILFVNDIVVPDAALPQRKNGFVDESVAFVGDMHMGSARFMEDKFLKFVDYLNLKVPGTEDEARKIKYVFIVGDLIAGVGNYPGQEFELALPGDIESHFEYAANLLGKIRSDIKIIISPGNHDGVRIMEPQPMFNEKFAWRLYNMKNVILTTNPAQVNIGAKEGFDGFDVLTYHGFSYFFYADNILPLMLQKASHKPELVMEYLLKYRHLAPTHSSVQYYPGEVDAHAIVNLPDIFLSGHVHKSAVAYYNNILLVSVSGWEAMTDYMEKRGAKPDFCKVPVFNLKTRAIKMLDFDEEGHGHEGIEGVNKNE